MGTHNEELPKVPREYTEQDLLDNIKWCTEQGLPDSLKYYQGELERIRAK